MFRITCCIQDALTEISKVVQDDPSSSKAILIKAEIFYEMGLFEQVGWAVIGQLATILTSYWSR